MNKTILIGLIIIFLTGNIAYTKDNCEIICNTKGNTAKENIINKITGFNFLSQKTIEKVIQTELNKEISKGFRVELEIYNLKGLKNGEFKSLKISNKNIFYKGFSMSDFNAETICPMNKIIYKNNKVYYPDDIAFKYEGTITNEDLLNTINSKEFQKELNKISSIINSTGLFELKSPKIQLSENRLNFEIPIKTFFGSFKIKFKADIEAKNNKIELKNITFNSKSNIINDSMSNLLTEKINPISYELDNIKGKYFKIYIKEAKIENNIIKTNGIFKINKNYGG